MVRLHDVVAAPGFGVRVEAAAQRLDDEITGAVANEHLDPTPWVSGTVLLMTDGIQFPDDPGQLAAYVARLKAAKIRGLAVGVGAAPLRFRSVPRHLVDAAEAVQLPVLSVPSTTPFRKITELVYGLMVEQRFTATRHLADGQHALAVSAAQSDAIPAVVSALGRLTGLWAILTDPHGAVLTATRTDPAGRQAALSGAREQVRAQGLRGSATLSGPSGTMHVLPVGTERLRGMLAYGVDRREAIGQVQHTLARFSVHLLAMQLERRHAMNVLQRRPGAEAAARLLAGLKEDEAWQLLSAAGVRADRFRVLVTAAGSAPWVLLDELADAVPSALLRHDGSELLALVPADVPDVAERLGRVLGTRAAGLGGPVRPHECPLSLRQARRALALGHAGLVDAMSLGTVRFLLSLGRPEALASFADAVLGPVEAHCPAATGPSAADLVTSLHTLLEHNVQLDAAAGALGIHRHTMRSHKHRIEQLTGRDLDSAQDRGELWLAFQAREALAVSPSSHD